MVKKVGLMFVLLMCACGSNKDYSQSAYSLTQYCHKKNKTCICHIPPGNPENAHEICISDSALEAHWKHGKHDDYLGQCYRCGNETCDPTENCSVCSIDCGECPPPPPVCGNQTCDEGETCESCEVDCGQCPPVCGDQFCEERESCESCEVDCGECQPLSQVDAGLSDPDAEICQVDSSIITESSDAGGPDVRCHQFYCEEVDASSSGNLDAGATPDMNTIIPLQKPNREEAFAGGCMVNKRNNPSKGISLFLFLVILLLFLSFRKRSIFYLVILIVSSLPLFANVAYAFPNTQNFNPTSGSSDYFVTQDAKLTLPSAKLFYQYEHRPLRLITKPKNSTIVNIIDSRHTFHLLFSTNVYNRIQLSLDLPFIIDQNPGDLNPVGLNNLSNGLGDLRFLVKAKLFNLGRVNFAGSLDWALPTATADLVGEKYGSMTPSIISSISFGLLDLSANVGFRLRANETFSSPGIQTQGGGQLFIGSLAVRYNFKLNDNYNLALVSDARVLTTLSSVTQEEVPFEWLNGFQFGMPNGWRFDIGAGWGATRGVGNPIPRVFAGLSWARQKRVKCKEEQPRIINRWRNKIIPLPIPVPTPVIINFPSVFFDTDRHELRPEAQKELTRVANLLKRFPQIRILRIEGHTDYRASKKYNQILSEQRVQAVIDFLMFLGVETKLEKQGFGELAPLDKTKTQEGMQKNRRVDLRIIKIKR